MGLIGLQDSFTDLDVLSRAQVTSEQDSIDTGLKLKYKRLIYIENHRIIEKRGESWTVKIAL